MGPQRIYAESLPVELLGWGMEPHPGSRSFLHFNIASQCVIMASTIKFNRWSDVLLYITLTVNYRRSKFPRMVEIYKQLKENMGSVGLMLLV